ncbi:MAG TPA: 5-formyltetrahydrofolate cyclo-ligase [Polyangia bacterium]|nr:5-formyltetrahydrofolate cyclo-ligase [Polyangia bacterium]
MTDDLSAQKRALRDRMRAAREALDTETRVALTVSAVERLLSLPAFARVEGRAVAGYVAIGRELSPAGALGYVADGDGTIALPRVSDAPPRLRFHTIAPGTRLRAGRFGLSEPPDTAPEIAARDLAVMIVPGLAFDAAGRRLGFGGGYYDGVIDDARAGGAAVIGFAYDFQIVDRVPAGPDDRGVDVVVTDARVITVSPGS